MIVLDTTVLVYAKGVSHPLRDPCRDLVAGIAADRVEAATTVEAIQEFVHVRACRRDRCDAASLGQAYAELLAPLLPVGADELRAGLTVFSATPELGAFDAVLAAATMAAGADALVSADRGFGAVPGLSYVFPDAEAVAALLGT